MLTSTLLKTILKLKNQIHEISVDLNWVGIVNGSNCSNLQCLENKSLRHHPEAWHGGQLRFWLKAVVRKNKVVSSLHKTATTFNIQVTFVGPHLGFFKSQNAGQQMLTCSTHKENHPGKTISERLEQPLNDMILLGDLTHTVAPSLPWESELSLCFCFIQCQA